MDRHCASNTNACFMCCCRIFRSCESRRNICSLEQSSGEWYVTLLRVSTDFVFCKVCYLAKWGDNYFKHGSESVEKSYVLDFDYWYVFLASRSFREFRRCTTTLHVTTRTTRSKNVYLNTYCIFVWSVNIIIYLF